MNTIISRKEQKPQIFIGMTIVLAFVALLSLILNTSSVHGFQPSILFPRHPAQVLFDAELPIAVPVPQPPVEAHRLSAMPATPVAPTPAVVPQPVPVPVPSVP